MNPHRVEGVIKTVKPCDVESWTGRGWVVVGSYQDTLMRVIPELVDLMPGQTCHAGASYMDANGLWQVVPMGKTAVNRFIPENVTYFVLQKDPESVIGDLAKQIADRDKKLASIEDEWKKKLAESQKEDAKKYVSLVEKYVSLVEDHKLATALLKKGLKEAEEALKVAMSGAEVESLKKVVKTLKSECDRLQKELEDSRRERFGVRTVDLSDDVVAE